MNPSTREIKLILDMNTRLFINALEGVSEKQWSERLSGHSNPLSWIASHNVDSRYFMLLFLGKPATSPYHDLFVNFKGYDAALQYPSADSVKHEWKIVSELLSQALVSVTPEVLNADSVIKSPIGDHSNLGTLAFVTQHESYDIGQMGFLKKYFTKEAMKYS